MKKALGAGCLILFAAPFAATGIFLFYTLTGWIRAGETPQRIFMLTFFALACTMAGFGIIGAGIWSAQQRDPDPTAKRILDQGRASMFFLWMFCILWNSVASPVLIFLPDELRKGNYLVLIGLLFPLVGLGIFIAAMRATIRAFRFHRSTLVLTHAPVPVGGALRAHVEVPYAPLANATAIIARLTSIHRKRSGKSTTDVILWQDEQEVGTGALGRIPNGVSIPVFFRVPKDSEPTGPSPLVFWHLTVDAEVPGVDYSAKFEVPVARVAVPVETQLAPAPHRVAPPAAPVDYIVEQTVNGSEIYMPPFRSKSSAFSTLVFTLLWSTVVFVLLTVDAPLWVSILFALFDLLLISVTLDLFFASDRIILGRDEVTLRRKRFEVKETKLKRSEIESSQAVISGQSGQKPFYDVEVQDSAGKKYKAARHMRSKREAEWVASQIRGAIDSPA